MCLTVNSKPDLVLWGLCRRSSRSGVFRPHSPLRTVRDSFPSYRSSISKATLGGRPDRFTSMPAVPGTLGLTGLTIIRSLRLSAILFVPAFPEVLCEFWHVRISCRWDFYMSPDSYSAYSHDLVDFLYLFLGFGFDSKKMFLS